MMDFQKYLLFLHPDDQITKQPRNMKLRTTISLLALAAMFAFSTPAEAQWGSLIKGARKTLGIKTKKEKREEAALKEQQRKRDERARQRTRRHVFDRLGLAVSAVHGNVHLLIRHQRRVLGGLC